MRNSGEGLTSSTGRPSHSKPVSAFEATEKDSVVLEITLPNTLMYSKHYRDYTES